MIEKNKKAIIKGGGRDVNVTIEDVEMYLEDVKQAINAGRYRIAMNENRQDNQHLFVVG